MERDERGARLAIGTMVGLPLFVYYLYFALAFNAGELLPGAHADPSGFFAAIVPTLEAGLAYVAWLLFQALLHVVLPGRTVEGLPLLDGRRLRYRLNGFAALILTGALLGAGQVFGLMSLSWVYDNFGALLSVITICSFAISLFVLYWGRTRPGGPSQTSGSFPIDYFFGVALNPRIPPVTGFDLKFFFESRPGLIGWLVVDFAFAATQWERLGQISLPMVLILAMQIAYVATAFWWEEGLLSMIDISTERFGWMLVYGDAALVPMTYSLQAFYLIDHTPDMPAWYATFVALLFMTGLYVFRGANSQKHRFRRDPTNCRIWGQPARYITTSRGTPLLVSGFWGLARHPNYLGDLIMAVAMSMTTMFGSVVPYYYPLWLTTLLLGRQRRDERWCEQKYGTDWSKYRQRVRFRIVPGVY